MNSIKKALSALVDKRLSPALDQRLPSLVDEQIGKKMANLFQGKQEAAPEIWENLITLNSDAEPNFELLGPAKDYYETDARKDSWQHLDFKSALEKDVFPLPATKDREGYYGDDHFSYWASGLADARTLIDLSKEYGSGIGKYLDLGCASGRVLRHVANELPNSTAIGCDINRFHVEWCNAHLPANSMAFQNNSIPSLPIESNSLDVVSAFSVFTHIEALETGWLAEIRRVLKPGGLAWLTVHTEHTLSAMTDWWPLWDPIMGHPDAAQMLDENRNFEGDRLVFRWHKNKSYSSNVFYKSDYLTSRWSRILDFVELRREFPQFQDVMIMRKPG